MNRKVFTLIVGIGIALFASLPFGMGYMVKNHLTKLAVLSQSQGKDSLPIFKEIRITLLSYHTGWLRSHGKFTVQLTDEAEGFFQTYTVPFQVQNGPLFQTVINGKTRWVIGKSLVHLEQLDEALTQIALQASLRNWQYAHTKQGYAEVKTLLKSYTALLQHNLSISLWDVVYHGYLPKGIHAKLAQQQLDTKPMTLEVRHTEKQGFIAQLETERFKHAISGERNWTMALDGLTVTSTLLGPYFHATFDIQHTVASRNQNVNVHAEQAQLSIEETMKFPSPGQEIAFKSPTVTAKIRQSPEFAVQNFSFKFVPSFSHTSYPLQDVDIDLDGKINPTNTRLDVSDSLAISLSLAIKDIAPWTLEILDSLIEKLLDDKAAFHQKTDAEQAAEEEAVFIGETLVRGFYGSDVEQHPSKITSTGYLYLTDGWMQLSGETQFPAFQINELQTSWQCLLAKVLMQPEGQYKVDFSKMNRLMNQLLASITGRSESAALVKALETDLVKQSHDSAYQADFSLKAGKLRLKDKLAFDLKHWLPQKSKKMTCMKS